MRSTHEHDPWLEKRQARLNSYLKRLLQMLAPRAVASVSQDLGAMTYGLAMASKGLAFVARQEEMKPIHNYIFDLLARLQKYFGFEPGDCTTDIARREGMILFTF